LYGVYRRPMEAIFEIWQIIGFLILRAQASDLRCYGGQIKSDLVPERKCLLVGQKMPSDDLDWMGGQTVNLWPTRCGELSICGSPSCHFGWKDQFHAISTCVTKLTLGVISTFFDGLWSYVTFHEEEEEEEIIFQPTMLKDFVGWP